MTLSVWAPDGAPEIGAGDDLAALFLGLVGPDDLADGDVVVVTSKVVAKAEGRVREGDRDRAIAGETVRVVARRGQGQPVAGADDRGRPAPSHHAHRLVGDRLVAAALTDLPLGLRDDLARDDHDVAVGQAVGADQTEQDRREVVAGTDLGGPVGRPDGESHATSSTAAAAIAAVASRSVIRSGTARQGRPASTTRRTSSASATSTSQPSSRPPSPRGP